MTSTPFLGSSVVPAGDGQTAVSHVARRCDAALEVTVAVLATWTVVYHLCLLSSLGVAPAVGLETAALVTFAVLARRARRRWEGGPQPGTTPEPAPAPGTAAPVEPVLVDVAAACGLFAAVLVAADDRWPAIAWLWLVTAAAGTIWALLLLRRDPELLRLRSLRGGRHHREEHWSAVVALGWATALAVLSVFTLWPNPDDLYYVNLSQWVAEHGTFPVRDTIFSDLVFPMSSWPPIASYDALAGTLARLTGVHAASVVYLVVPPVATFLSVLALWRLLRAWRVSAVSVALSVALLFLLFDGGPGYAAPGNLFLIRIWQGKVILLCLMVPILLVYALRYVERPTTGRAGWLFAGGVAAVGLSTTAMFLVPLVALAGAAPLVLRRPGRALLGFAAMSAYPLAAGVTTVAVGGHSADLFGSRELYRFDPAWFGNQIFRDGPLALVAVAAVLGGAFLVPHPAARVTTGVLTFVTGVTLVPGVTRLSYDLVGLGPTLWRVSWVASIAALVGVLAARFTDHHARPTFQLIGPVAVVAAIVAFGVPIVSDRNGVYLVSGPHWQRGSDSVDTAQLVIAAARPGDLVLAPQEIAISIDVLTTGIKTVAPREYFMDYLRDDPRFHFDMRTALVTFANHLIGRSDKPAVARALKRLGVDVVCLPRGSRKRIGFLSAHGYRYTTGTALTSCFSRRP